VVQVETVVADVAVRRDRELVDERRAAADAASRILIGYARCSTDKQDLTTQRHALCELGVNDCFAAAATFRPAGHFMLTI
jgi:hypothetical protein